MSTFPTIIAVVAMAISLLTYFAAFVFALQNRSKSSRASNYVLIGLGILVASRMLTTVGFAVIGRTLTPATMAQVAVLIQVLSSLTFAVALGFLVAAAFVDREKNPVVRDEFLDGDNRPSQSDANPYSTTTMGDS